MRWRNTNGETTEEFRRRLDTMTYAEYLEGVLPPDIRDRLWPFVSDRPRKPQDSRARDEILADLLRSNESIMLNLEELRRRTGTGPP